LSPQRCRGLGVSELSPKPHIIFRHSVILGGSSPELTGKVRWCGGAGVGEGARFDSSAKAEIHRERSTVFASPSIMDPSLEVGVATPV